MKYKLLYPFIVSIVVLVLLSMSANQAQAQFNALSYPFNTHYYFHKYPVNPAYIGEEGEANIGLGYKKANGFFQTAGNRAFAYVHGKSDAMKGGGFGVLFNYMDANDQGIKHTQMSLGGTATYNQSLMDLVDIKIGVTTSLLRYKNNRAPTTGSPNNPQNPQTTLERFAKVNLDAGLLLSLADFELGFAMHHNNEPEFQFFTTGAGQNRFRREIFITAAYQLDITDAFGIEPHLILQQNSLDKDLLTQISILGDYRDMVFAGFAYIRDFDANRNPNTNYLTKEFHKFRVTAAGKFAEQYLVAASVDFVTNSVGVANVNPFKMQIETSVGYFFNRVD